MDDDEDLGTYDGNPIHDMWVDDMYNTSCGTPDLSEGGDCDEDEEWFEEEGEKGDEGRVNWQDWRKYRKYEFTKKPEENFESLATRIEGCKRRMSLYGLRLEYLKQKLGESLEGEQEKLKAEIEELEDKIKKEEALLYGMLVWREQKIDAWTIVLSVVAVVVAYFLIRAIMF